MCPFYNGGLCCPLAMTVNMFPLPCQTMFSFTMTVYVFPLPWQTMLSFCHDSQYVPFYMADYADLLP